MSKPSDVVTARRPGIFQRTLVRMLMRDCVVVSNELPAEGFRLISLQGASLKGVRWRPGQKIQVNQGLLFGDRTYTPLSWDEDQGITRLLVRAIGQGPGAEWAMNVQPGDTCQFAGPSAAVELDRPGRTLLFGDETSVASMIAAVGQPTADVQGFIEADDHYTCQDMTMQFGLNAHWVQRCPDATHLKQIAKMMINDASKATNIVLTGRASSIQHLHRALRSLNLSARIVTKAFWAENKAGLS